MGETEGKLNMIKTQNLQGEDSTLVMSGYYTTYKQLKLKGSDQDA